MALLGQNGHGQWQHDPQLVQRRTIIGITVGGTLALAVLIFVLVYFVVISPPKPPSDESKDESLENDRFACSSN